MSIKIEENPYAPLDPHTVAKNVAAIFKDAGGYVPPIQDLRNAAEKYAQAKVTLHVPLLVYSDILRGRYPIPEATTHPQVTPKKEVVVFRR